MLTSVHYSVKMKFALVLLAVLSVAYGHHVHKVPTRGLQEDFQDFLALVPVEKLEAIIRDHIANDPDFKAVIAYVQSEDFKKIILTIDALPTYIEFLNYLQASGLDAYGAVNNLHELLNLPTLAPPTKSRAHSRHARSLSAMIDEVIVLLPRDQLKALFQEKLETSPEFKALFDRLRSDEFQSIIKTLNALPEYQDVLQKLRDNGIDVDKYIALIRALFGL